MADGAKLVITFLDAYNAERMFSFNYANPNVSENDVKLVAQTIIANGSIFKNVPVTVKSAKFITTTVTNVDIS